MEEETRILSIILLWIGTWGLIDTFLLNIKSYTVRIIFYICIVIFSYLYLKKKVNYINI